MKWSIRIHVIGMRIRMVMWYRFVSCIITCRRLMVIRTIRGMAILMMRTVRGVYGEIED
jgi:hypothetical protein